MWKLFTAAVVATAAMSSTANASDERVSDWELLDGQPLAHQEHEVNWYTKVALLDLEVKEPFANTEGMDKHIYSGQSYPLVGEGIAVLAMDIESVSYSNFKNAIQRICNAVREYPNDTDYLKGVTQIRITTYDGFEGYTFMGGRSACFEIYDGQSLGNQRMFIRALSEKRSFSP